MAVQWILLFLPSDVRGEGALCYTDCQNMACLNHTFFISQASPDTFSFRGAATDVKPVVSFLQQAGTPG